jgi:hypothetical protein
MKNSKTSVSKHLAFTEENFSLYHAFQHLYGYLDLVGSLLSVLIPGARVYSRPTWVLITLHDGSPKSGSESRG